MFEKSPKKETRHYDETIQSMAAFFGMSNLSVQVTPGEGWSCGKTETGITISVDPDQLLRKNPETAKNIMHETRLEDILHTTAHEIGHARDIIDGGTSTTQAKNAAEHFFWNYIDDAVIDSRLRHIPRLNAATEDLYREVLFPTPNLSEHPEHMQLMYGTLLQSVAPQLHYDYSPRVESVLYTLAHYKLPNGQQVNVFHAMSQLSTDITMREKIAKQFILPYYNQFKNDHNRQQNNTSSESQNDEQMYQQHSTCSQEQHLKASSNTSQDGDKKDQLQTQQGSPKDSDSQQDNSQSNSLAEQIAEQFKEQLTEHAEKSENTISAQKSAEQDRKDIRHNSNKTKGGTDMGDNFAGFLQEEMDLRYDIAQEYAETLLKYRAVISRTADIFLKLSSYADATLSPRYETRSAMDGRRLHPNRLANAAIQSTTRRPEAVWQPVHEHSHRQEVRFGGLDIHLLVDVSGSMESGSKSYNASACAAILLEALDLAISRAQHQDNDYIRPDVRSQVIAFGSNHKVLSTLSSETTPKEKGHTYTNLRYPKASSTYVSSSLKAVVKQAKQFASRDHIVIIITDGDFSDGYEAEATAKQVPENISLTQINIDSRSRSLTPDEISLDSPDQLPKHLLKVVQNYLDTYQ